MAGVGGDPVLRESRIDQRGHLLPGARPGANQIEQRFRKSARPVARRERLELDDRLVMEDAERRRSVSGDRKRQIPHPQPRRLYRSSQTMVPGAMIPSFGTTMTPLRM